MLYFTPSTDVMYFSSVYSLVQRSNPKNAVHIYTYIPIYLYRYNVHGAVQQQLKCRTTQYSVVQGNSNYLGPNIEFFFIWWANLTLHPGKYSLKIFCRLETLNIFYVCQQQHQYQKKKGKYIICHLSPVTCHVSPVTCYLHCLAYFVCYVSYP